MQLIINPNSSRLKTPRRLNYFLNKIKKAFTNVHIDLTKAPLHASEIAYNAVKNGINKIISIGGDGTLNEVIQGIYNFENISLGIVPMGSGNDFARSLRLPLKPFKILNNIHYYRSYPIDIMQLNNKKVGVNIIGTGIDAEVVKTLNHGKNYFVGFYSALLKHKTHNYNITIDDNNYRFKDVNLIIIANGKYFGHNMKIAPHAQIDDGEMDIIIIKGLSRFRLFMLFPSVYLGQHVKHSAVISLKGKHVSITEERGKSMFIEKDGELEQLKNIDIQLIKRKINFLLPRQLL